MFGPDAATRYVVYHGYVDGKDGRKVCIDRLRWAGDRPLIEGPSDELPPPPPAVFDEEVADWAAEAWVRGSWVDVCGRRFRLPAADAWHQVEVERCASRLHVRAGGVLLASQPAAGARERPRFETDGDLGPFTVTSCAVDSSLHELPARSAFGWWWGGRGPFELSLAVSGAATVQAGGDVIDVPPDSAFRVVTLQSGAGADEIVVTAGDDGASVADLAVYARPG